MNWLSGLVFMSLLASVLAGGYPNLNCPAPGNATVRLECAKDCQQQHGALTGVCGDVSEGDYTCFCQGRPETIHRSNLQCKEVADYYRNLCTHDCLCNHAALGGHCNWDLGICNCVSSGQNMENIGCPAKTAEEWKAIVFGMEKLPK